MPVFVHAAAPAPFSYMPVAIPIDAEMYLPLLAASPPGVKPGSGAVGKAPRAYIQVWPADEAIYHNYTDFVISILYDWSFPGSPRLFGWRYLTMRFNNDDNTLTALRFPGVGWVPNIDQSFTTLGDVDQNPLKIIKRPTYSGPGAGTAIPVPSNTSPNTASATASVTKLHVYIDEHLNFLPSFPPGTSNDVIAQREDAPGLFHWDSGACTQLVEAACLGDDGVGWLGREEKAGIRAAFMDMEEGWAGKRIGIGGEVWEWRDGGVWEVRGVEKAGRWGKAIREVGFR